MTEEVSRPKTCVGCVTGADCDCSEQAVICERKQQLWDSGYAFCSRSMKRAALLLAAEAVQEERHKAERAASNPAILPGEITRLWLEALAKQLRLAEDGLRARADLEPVAERVRLICDLCGTDRNDHCLADGVRKCPLPAHSSFALRPEPAVLRAGESTSTDGGSDLAT